VAYAGSRCCVRASLASAVAKQAAHKMGLV